MNIRMTLPIIETCHVCGFGQHQPLRNYEKHHLVRCRRCSFVFSNIKPTEEELRQVYEGYNRGLDGISSTTIAKLHERAVALISLSGANAVLDIACGDGNFLQRFKELGCQVFGTEYDRESELISEARGITMLPGGLMPKLPSVVSDVDLIIFTEVIEHINNPQEVLSHIHGLLKPNGLLFITTPNFDSLERRILGNQWGMVMYPEHISYYTPKTLDMILKTKGFEKISIYAENISVFRVFQFINRTKKDKSNVIDAEAAAVKASAVVSGNSTVHFLKDMTNEVLKFTYLGSSIVATYRKVT